jgi:hypothetical protein
MEHSDGRYDERTNTIIINSERDTFKWGEGLGGTIVSTAIEETIHAYQRQLTEDRWGGRMNAGDSLRHAHGEPLPGIAEHGTGRQTTAGSPGAVEFMRRAMEDDPGGAFPEACRRHSSTSRSRSMCWTAIAARACAPIW